MLSEQPGKYIMPACLDVSCSGSCMSALAGCSWCCTHIPGKSDAYQLLANAAGPFLPCRVCINLCQNAVPVTCNALRKCHDCQFAGPTIQSSLNTRTFLLSTQCSGELTAAGITVNSLDKGLTLVCCTVMHLTLVEMPCWFCRHQLQ